MREIKFRLYNKQTKVLVYDSNIQTSDNCLILDLDGNIIDIAFDRFENVAHCYFDVRLIEVVGNVYENPELL